MRFAKINRAGYPRNTVCAVLKHGERESDIRLPSGETVTLYTAFLYEDLETKRQGITTVKANAKSFLEKHPVRRR